MADNVTTAAGPDRFVFAIRFADAEQAKTDIAGLGRDMVSFVETRGVTPQHVNSLHVGLEELLTNLAKFGKAVEQGESVRADGAVEIAPDRIVLGLDDNCEKFDPRTLAAPDVDASPMDRAIGGLGIFMLFQLFDECKYSYTTSGNKCEWIIARQH